MKTKGYEKLVIGMCVVLTLCIVSCKASKNSCHGNGRKYYVSKDVRKAQSKRYAYRY